MQHPKILSSVSFIANSEWLNTFSEDIELIHAEGKEIIIMGDMNIDLTNCTNNMSNNARTILHILDNANLKQVISELFFSFISLGFVFRNYYCTCTTQYFKCVLHVEEI